MSASNELFWLYNFTCFISFCYPSNSSYSQDCLMVVRFVLHFS